MNDNPQKYDPLRARGSAGHAAEEPMPLLEYLQLLWFRRWIIVAITLIVGLSGWLWVNQQTPLYKATSVMILGSPAVGASSPELMMLAYFNKLAVADEIEVLKSRALAESLVQRLELLNYAEFNPVNRVPEPSRWSALSPRHWLPDSWREALSSALNRTPTDRPTESAIEQDQASRQLIGAINVLLAGLDVAASEMSNVIYVSFISPEPAIAALIANELPEAYIVSNLQARYEATEKATKWLSEQMNELRQEVEDAERAVEIYRSEHGLAEVGGTGLATEQLSVLNSQLIIARAERAEAEARLRQVQQLLQQNEGGAEAAARLSESTIVSQLRTQEVEAQKRISELAVEYGPKHPRMIQTQAELNQIQERMRGEIQKVEGTLESDLQFARAREESLAASVREDEAATGAQNRQSIQLRALEREAAASRTLFETFLEQFKQASTSEGLNQPAARLLSQAEVPGAPFYPNVRKQTLGFLMGGFALAVLLVFGIEALNPGITSPEQVEKELGTHTLGIVPATSRKEKVPDELPVDKPQSGYVEALNSLMVSLSLTEPDREPRTFQVTSSIPEEGKTTLALSLARLLVSRGKTVVLVDGDLRRAAIEKKLGVSRHTKGLTDLVLIHDSEVTDYLVDDPKSPLKVLAPGSAEFVNATDVLGSQRMAKVVADLKARFDYVIFDAPPVMAVADARLIGKLVEKTLFVVRWNRTPAKVAKAALKLLSEGDTDVAGVILLGVDLRRYGRVGYGDSGYYYHYGRYGKYYTS